MVPFRLPVEETLTIEKLVYGGEGLARQEGKVVLTPFVLPGEVVRAETERAKNDLWRGRVLEVQQASASRVTPGCPYFQRCGGCQYQHIDYPIQLEQKREILREVLRRVGKIEFAGEIGMVSGEPWHYRNRVQLHIEDGKCRVLRAGFAKALRDRSLPYFLATAERGHQGAPCPGSAASEHCHRAVYQ